MTPVNRWREGLPESAAVDHDVLLELLSERLLDECPPDVWRELFVGPGRDTVRFERGVVTFVSVAGLLPEWSRANLAAAARRFHGHVECPGPPPTFAFRDARHALQLAFQLQAESAQALAIALLSASCTTAHFRVDRCDGRVTLGSDARLAADRAARTSRGSVYVCGETFRLARRALEWRQRGAIVTKEVEGGVVTSALVTFPPRADAAVSTFAGLGLTPGPTG